MTNLLYVNTILSYFSSMDIDKLRLYLKDEYSYQETTKLIFLSKLDQVFSKFKGVGDTELLIYPGACAGKGCDNCDAKGYRFVGNHSKNYIDLLFVIISADIRDIFYCSCFISDIELDNLQNKESIYIDKDELVTFHKTPEYWEKVFSAINAYSELITDTPKQINFEELSYWLFKHSDLDESIGSYNIFKPKFKWTPFSRLYSELLEFKSYISVHITEFIQANNSFKEIVTEQNLIDSLLNYEAIYEAASADLHYSFKKKGENYILNEQDLILFRGEEFFQTLNFVEFYKDNYSGLLNKYTTYTNQEVSLLFNFSDSQIDTSDILSLKFHLERRKELEETGKTIPLYINKYEENL